ncbi:MAG TPA: hypothetical protein VKG02_11820, partial [Blastocatellia bacterium]|nr:hypothetical protein [Blastocatellia bacterium]
MTIGTFDETRIEEKIDKIAIGGLPVSPGIGSGGFGGVRFQSMMEVFEFGKIMALSGPAIKPIFRGNPGACLGITLRSLRFGFDPYSLQEHAYLTIKRGYEGAPDEETLAFDSFVIGAIINAHGGLQGLLRGEYTGEGDNLKLRVFGRVKGEQKDLEIETPTLAQIKAQIGVSKAGNFRGSPLWLHNPRQQIWYKGRRDWGRFHRPEVLMGWIEKDEIIDGGGEVIEHSGDAPRSPTEPRGRRSSGLARRLTGPKDGDRGFDADKVNATIDGDDKSPQSAGGHARAAALSPDERSEQASKAAQARWNKGGAEPSGETDSESEQSEDAANPPLDATESDATADSQADQPKDSGEK